MEIDIAEDCWLLKYYMQRSKVITVSTSGFSEVQRVGVHVPLEYLSLAEPPPHGRGLILAPKIPTVFLVSRLIMI